MRVRPTDLIRFARRSAAGFIAQGFTLAAIFLPVVFRLPDAVVFLVQVNAVAAFLLQIALLAVELRLPGIADDAVAERLVRAAVSGLLLVCLILVLGGGIASISVSSSFVSPVMLGAALLLAGQGIYVLGLSNLTRKLDYPTMMRGRFIYGVANATLTLVCCVAHLASGYFVVAVTISYLLATVLVRSIPLRSLKLVNLREFFGEARGGLSLMSSYAIGGFASSAASLGVGFAGPLQPAWAVTCRVMGGLQTVGGNVLGPVVDIGVADAVQNSNPGGAVRSFRLGVGFGAGLAAVFLVGTIAALTWTDALPSTGHLVALTIGGVGFCAAYVVQSPLTRMLGMIGRHSVRLAWDSARFATALVSLLLFRGDAMIIALGLQGVLSVVAYFMLCARAVRRFDPRPAPLLGVDPQVFQ